MILEEATPPGHELFVAPLAVHPEPGPPSTQRTELQPDILVAADADVTDKDLAGVPLLAVEVLSPSTQLFDRNLKKATYERIRTPHFWLVDPRVPEILAFTLDSEGHYAPAAHATADQVLRLELPLPIELRPSDLVRPRG
jgi:Uma2 family endonuclease